MADEATEREEDTEITETGRSRRRGNKGYEGWEKRFHSIPWLSLHPSVLSDDSVISVSNSRIMCSLGMS